MAGAWVIILRALCGPWAPFYGLRGGFGIPECQKSDHRVNLSRRRDRRECRNFQSATAYRPWGSFCRAAEA